MCLGALCVYAVVVNLVPLLLERGLSPFEAAVVLGLGGIGQVASRLGYSWFSTRTSAQNRSIAILFAIAITTAMFAILPGPLLLLFVLSLVSGGARGVFTLLQATAVSDRWGTVNFGHLNGIMLAPVMLATAAGPWLGSVLAQSLGSYAACFMVLSAFAFAAALLTPWTVSPRAIDR
jgi:cyanate permease